MISIDSNKQCVLEDADRCHVEINSGIGRDDEAQQLREKVHFAGMLAELVVGVQVVLPGVKYFYSCTRYHLQL